MNNEEQPPPSQDQETLPDMGGSLGYGQSADFQYFNAPQPTQSILQLRQERLQQLRAQRMRQQTRPDVTSNLKRLMRLPGSEAASLIVPKEDSSASSVGTKTLPQVGSTATHNTGAIEREQMGQAAMILAGAFVVSRVLGLVRGSLFTFVFGGASIVFDAYNQAFLVPDLIFTVIAGGALSSAFMPVFTAYLLNERNDKTAWRLASSALNLAFAIMIVVATLIIIFAQQIVPLYNYGVHGSELNLIISLTRIMLLQSIIMGGGVIVTSVLNARQHFLLPAIGTILYNVGIIAGLGIGILITAFNHLPLRSEASNTIVVYAASWGVVIGALLLVGVQMPGLFRVGIHYTFSFDWRHAGMIQIVRQMIPRIINAAMLSFSTAVDRNLILLLAGMLGTGAVSGLISQYLLAFSLVLLPLGIFGSAVSTAAFPSLNENVTRARFERVRSIILQTLRGILFLSIPSSAGLIILSVPIIQVLYEHGAFTFDNTQSMAVPLAFFALGLPGLAAVEILTRSFYALRNSKKPVFVSVFQFIFKIALSIVLINPVIWLVQMGIGTIFHTTLALPQLEGAWGMGALAFSTSLAGSLEAAVMLWLLHQDIGGLQLRFLVGFVGRILVATSVMCLALLICRWLLDMALITYGADNQSLNLIGILFALIKLALELFVGLFIYLRMTRLLSIEELGPMRRLLNRFKLSWV